MAERKITLIVSEEKEPVIKVKAGVSVELVQVSSSGQPDDTKTLATLCGYSSTYCIALVETQ
ncbi:hypothetical protein [Agrobacterium vitis]|uniref:Uncharacterized protein n=1 Tax=Agrobacterium vitis TaxID=373 RepID=A0A7K1RP02_AGRVI|nr:hypothetical protein [Agrobacterium vitis]MVA59592.1 hypothetical protein [Agrobacterium vitis]